MGVMRMKEVTYLLHTWNLCTKCTSFLPLISTLNIQLVVSDCVGYKTHVSTNLLGELYVHNCMAKIKRERDNSKPKRNKFHSAIAAIETVRCNSASKNTRNSNAYSAVIRRPLHPSQASLSSSPLCLIARNAERLHLPVLGKINTLVLIVNRNISDVVLATWLAVVSHSATWGKRGQIQSSKREAANLLSGIATGGSTGSKWDYDLVVDGIGIVLCDGFGAAEEVGVDYHCHVRGWGRGWGGGHGSGSVNTIRTAMFR